MSKPSLVFVLAEDEHHQRFIRKYLFRLGYVAHDLRFAPLPGGRGCGEQRVREAYANEVKAYRTRSARAASALIVVVDADMGDVASRVRQLRQALIEAGQDQRSTAERISHLIPKRNIETWILCLNGTSIDEDTDYRHSKEIDALIVPAASVFFEWTRPNIEPPQHCCPSLRAAIPEVRRIPSVGR